MLFEGIHHGQRVDHRGQHAHIVGRHAIHAPFRGVQSAKNVAPSDYQSYFDPEILNLLDLTSDCLHRAAVNPGPVITHQGFAGYFQEDSLVRRPGRIGVHVIHQDGSARTA
jgi:hypothetical protein